MATANIEDALKKYPELRLVQKDHKFCLYKNGKYSVQVPNSEAKLYVRTYEYCKTLVKLDRYDAAKEIAFSRNNYNHLPFDRLPFLALLTDMGHLIETVEMQPKLEINPQVRGRKVSFFYEEGNRHQEVKKGFVGCHLRINSLCEEDVKHKKFDKAILRAITTPLSSRLIATYDAHIQCNLMMDEHDYASALRMSNEFDLERNIKQEFFDNAMPLALKYRTIYQQQSLEAANHFARTKGFQAIIRNGKLVTIKKLEAHVPADFRNDTQPMLADVPTLHYAISDSMGNRQPLTELSH